MLYLVRHGDAEDDALTDIGRRQSELLAQRLRDVRFDAVHNSASPRAAETARVVTDALGEDVPVHATDLLCECVPVVPELLTDSQQVRLKPYWSRKRRQPFPPTYTVSHRRVLTSRLARTASTWCGRLHDVDDPAARREVRFRYGTTYAAQPGNL